MESRDEETLELKETYTSLQQEVDIKTKKLKKVGGGGAGDPEGGCTFFAQPFLTCVPLAPALFQAPGCEG